MAKAKIALVAGASSGLGRAVAEALAADGNTVYAGARSFARGAAAPAGCRALALDVTDGDSVRAAISDVIAQQGRVDTLICCAATFTMAPLEELPPETLADMMQVNLIGAARCVQAALPHMRKQGSGHIVLFSSLNGLFSIPFQGAYSATKHAIEAYSEALSQETRQFGIRVTVVEPGDCSGGSQQYRLTHIGDGSPYTEAFRAGTQKIRHDESHGLPPQRVGRAVARAVHKKRPPARLVVASLEQRSGAWLHKMLPRGLFNRVIELYYR
ncbi:MAG: SDR family oxidoreductase [Clostridia bacterium]|nr:SDR family oxidoreductase [Clostridia bacterium]